MSYTIHVDTAKRRVWTINPVPVADLRDIVALAARTIGGRKNKIVFVTDVALCLGASLALCARADLGAWRDELGLPYPTETP